MPGQVSSIKYLLLLNAEILFCGNGSAIWYWSVLLRLPLIFYFLFARLSHKRFFVISHSTFYGRRSSKEGAAAGATHTMCPWLAGRSRWVRFCVHSIPFQPCRPFFAELREEREPAGSNNDPVENNGQRPGQVALGLSESLNVKYCVKVAPPSRADHFQV